jgi:hypothetical protein
MYQVQNPSISEYYTPSSEPFGIYLVEEVVTKKAANISQSVKRLDCGLTRVRGRTFHPHQCSNPAWDPTIQRLFVWYRGLFHRCYIHPMPRLRISGDMHPVLHMALSLINHSDNFTLESESPKRILLFARKN